MKENIKNYKSKMKNRAAAEKFQQAHGYVAVCHHVQPAQSLQNTVSWIPCSQSISCAGYKQKSLLQSACMNIWAATNRILLLTVQEAERGGSQCKACFFRAWPGFTQHSTGRSALLLATAAAELLCFVPHVFINNYEKYISLMNQL